ncbi:MAG: hypothetical protein LBN40_01470 [Oscillospiraceae bacterium]|jgi:hypothetical protein|nr:hypothetical protein [Oscillospiraceae bacterium]
MGLERVRVTKDACINYASNIKMYYEMLNTSFNGHREKEDVLELWRNISAGARFVMSENTDFIKNCLDPALSPDTLLTENELLTLCEFAESLFYLTPDLAEETSVDIFLAADIYNSLLGRLEQMLDTTFGAEHIFWKEKYFRCARVGAYAYFSLSSLVFIDEAKSVLDRFILRYPGIDWNELETLELRQQTLGIYLVVCITIINLGQSGKMDHNDAYAQYIGFKNRIFKAFETEEHIKHGRIFDDNFEAVRDNYVIESQLYHTNFAKSIGFERTPADKAMSRELYGILEKSLDSFELSTFLTPAGIVPENLSFRQQIFGMVCLKVLYCLEYIDFDDVLTGYVKIAEATFEFNYEKLVNEQGDLSYITQKVMATFLAVVGELVCYNDLLSKEQREICSKFQEGFIAYIGQFPMRFLADLSGYPKQMNAIISVSDSIKKDEAINTLLKCTTGNHLPTLVHSMVVSKLMRFAASWFIDNEPYRLVGIADTKTPEEVVSRKDDVLEEVRLAGRAHDLGKVNYISAVSRMTRPIRDNEFRLIKHHPIDGSVFLDSERFACQKYVARYHHRTAHGTSAREYPQLPEDKGYQESPYFFLSKLCFTFDGLDAATDFVGRGYQAVKDPDLAMDEMINDPEYVKEATKKWLERGAVMSERFRGNCDPEITKILLIPEVREEMKAILKDYREGSYYNVYREFRE